MKLLRVVLITVLAVLCATNLSSCSHRRDRRKDFENRGYGEKQDDDDQEGSSKVDHSDAAWRRRIIATKASHEWRSFKSAFRKRYSSKAEEEKRIANYLAIKDMIEKHNSLPNENFKMRINHFADRSDEELERMNGFIAPNASQELRNSKQRNAFVAGYLKKPAPESWDWREHEGILAEVKSQGQCGACWAFTAAALLESQQKKIGMQLTQLSAQQILDCERKLSLGCKGGYIHAALEYVVNAGGIEEWSTYPYEEARLQCRSKPKNYVMKGGQWISIKDLKEEEVKKVVAHYGPVAVAIRAKKDLYFWDYGVYDKCNPGETVDHAVLLVGYGTQEGMPYWLYKNSWGALWGDDGYGRMKRGVNMCGVNNQRVIVQIGPK